MIQNEHHQNRNHDDPNTFEGKKLADGLEQKLKEQCAFSGRKEDTRYIIVDATYHFSIKDGDSE